MFAVKEALARDLQARDQAKFAKEGGNNAFVKRGLPPAVWDFFNAGKRSDWPRMCTIFTKQIAPQSYQFDHPSEPNERYSTTAWQPINEAHFTYRQLSAANPKHLLAFGREIRDSLPTNSIFFTGTDAGRFVVDFVSTSSERKRSFFLISQNALSDGMYLEYLRATCSGRIQIPTPEDSSAAFADYLADARRRLEANQLKPGEEVKSVDGRVQTSGIVPVMEVNARIAPTIFHKNPSVEFFIDHRWPFDWTYPHAVPHGFVIRLSRDPMPELDADVVRRDHQFWADQAAKTIGRWLSESTSVQEICSWIERVYWHKDLTDFSGDVDYISTAKNWKGLCDWEGASAVFAKSRANIAELYAWRTRNTKTGEEKAQMSAEADFAFRQAVALGPTQSDAVFGYYRFLVENNRGSEALILVQTVSKLIPENKEYQEFVRQVANAVEGKVAPTQHVDERSK